MAQVRVPPNCQGMTLTTSGAVTAVNNIITCTALEATTLTSPYTCPNSEQLGSSAANGTCALWLPTVITNITINSIGYAVDATGRTAPIPGADATAYIAGLKQREAAFELVIG